MAGPEIGPAPVVPAAASINPDPELARIAGSAKIYFAGLILGVILLVSAPALHVALLGPLAGVLIAVTSVPLVLAVRPILPTRDPLVPRLVTGIGLLPPAVSLVINGASIAGLDLSIWAGVSAILGGGWMALVGLSGTRLPRPIPRRAVVGGIGGILVGVGLFVDTRSPWLWAIAAVALVLSVSALGFLFGLMDLDNPQPVAAR